MSELVIWRDWFDKAAVAQLTAMGTLPRNEFEFNGWAMDGSDVAQAIAEEQHKFDSTSYCDGGRIEILEPEKFAGVYEIHVDWEPSFHANPAEDTE